MKSYLVKLMLSLIECVHEENKSPAFADAEHNEIIAENIINLYKIESTYDIEREKDDIHRILYIISSISAGSRIYELSDAYDEEFTDELACVDCMEPVIVGVISRIQLMGPDSYENVLSNSLNVDTEVFLSLINAIRNICIIPAMRNVGYRVSYRSVYASIQNSYLYLVGLIANSDLFDGYTFDGRMCRLLTNATIVYMQ